MPAVFAMPEEETARLCRLAQQGDRQAEALLVDAHAGLVRKAIRRLIRPAAVDIEDLFQEGRLALVRCVRRFDPSRGCRWR